MIEIIVTILVITLLVGILSIVTIYVLDRTQTTQAVRRNYPVIGRFRYLFEHLGEFFRQYFFAMDREELPFNRAQRSWVYRAAKNVERTIAFGSTRDLRPPGTIIFVNCGYPTLERDAVAPEAITLGPNCTHPYTTSSLFNISGMSYGAISKPAILALSRGATQAGIWLNTGEGGLSAHHLDGGCDIVFQIGTAKYGVRDANGDLSESKLRELSAQQQVRMIELKLSQGAKPGKGGILPKQKITPEIAAIRGIPMDEDSISPNRHPDIADADQLLDNLQYIREVCGKPVGFKAVIGAYSWLEALCGRINARGLDSAPDFITVDSADGGTGAAPQSLMDYMGLPIRESLPLTVDILSKYKLRERIKVIASGKLINPSEVAWAIAMGADFVVSARGFMFALGCIQALQCNKNTCPTGITTHNPKLQRGLVPDDKSLRVARYAANVVYEVGVIANSCGVREPRKLRRYHARMMMVDGKSKALDDIYPYQNSK